MIQRRVYFYPSGFAGMAFYAHKLCNALQKEGMEVTLFAYQNYELDHLPALFQKRKILSCGSLSFQYQQSHLRRILRILWAKSTNFFLFYRAARRGKPHIVHIQELFYPLDWIFIYLFTKTPCKLILTVHDVLPHKFYTRHFTFFEIKIIGLIYHWVDTLVVHSETNRKQLLDRFRILPQKVVVVPHGEYSLQEFLPPLPLTREEARESLGLPAGKKVLLFFGHIRQGKGLDILLRAFQQVLSVEKNVLLVIAGLPMQGESFELYERLIYQLNLQSKVFCFLEYIDLKDVPRYFISADIVCLPYIR
jgi:glycosyltransferase involved in cell wall biosynthesis